MWRLFLNTWVIRMRPSVDLFRASWKAEKRAPEPGMATETNLSLPRACCQRFREIRFESNSSRSRLAKDALRWAGNSIVWRIVSIIHPSITLRVLHEPSPFINFFKETALFRLSQVLAGVASTWSIAWKRCERIAFIRLALPWASWMKSSTNTSVSPTGLFH